MSEKQNEMNRKERQGREEYFYISQVRRKYTQGLRDRITQKLLLHDIRHQLSAVGLRTSEVGKSSTHLNPP